MISRANFLNAIFQLRWRSGFLSILILSSHTCYVHTCIKQQTEKLADDGDRRDPVVVPPRLYVCMHQHFGNRKGAGEVTLNVGYS